jgi:urease accessory protein
MERPCEDRNCVGIVALVALMPACMAFPGTASAHIIGVRGMGFAGGFEHPFSGYDHLLAMMAVGFWAARLGGRALWLLPSAFLSAAAVACLLAIGGGGLGAVTEAGIALSLVVLGTMIALELRPGQATAVAMVALFGLCHGYAHGVVMPAAASPLGYAAGFLTATAMLHAVGVGLGTMAGAMTHRHASQMLPRLAGAAVALPGLLLLAFG